MPGRKKKQQSSDSAPGIVPQCHIEKVRTDPTESILTMMGPAFKKHTESWKVQIQIKFHSSKGHKSFSSPLYAHVHRRGKNEERIKLKQSLLVSKNQWSYSIQWKINITN